MNYFCAGCRVQKKMEHFQTVLHCKMREKDFDLSDEEIQRISQILDGLISECTMCKRDELPTQASYYDEEIYA